MRNRLEVSLANFTVNAGENRLQRPVGGGTVEAGVLKGGSVRESNLSVDTSSGVWAVRNDLGGMFIQYDDEDE